MKPVLEVNNIGKAYRDYGGEWRRVLSWFGLPLKPRAEHWTLRDISFSIHPGEAVGIVGQNGTGKSTLLKIITGTLKPSTGHVRLHGSIAAILELGMGFHPELTGRQNAFHAAGLMGYSREQINAVIGDIEAFAEIGEYFDQPVRTYSSGMHVRVAFSVATAFRPDILIIDEALSVGDAYFQHKSAAKIRQQKENGTALLLVSHDSHSIMSMCDSALLIDRGRLLAQGTPENIVNVYAAQVADREINNELLHHALSQKKERIRSGNQRATIINYVLLDREGAATEKGKIGDLLVLQADVIVHHSMRSLSLGLMLRDRYGLPVFGTNSTLQKKTADHPKIHEKIRFIVSFNADIGAGQYSMTLALEDEYNQRLDWIDHAIALDIESRSIPDYIGCCPMRIEFSTPCKIKD